MPSKANKELVKFLEANGFEYDRTNSKQYEFYKHASYGEISVNPTIDEHAARHLKVTIQKSFGMVTDRDKVKRSPEAIRERQAAERERLAADIERHQIEIADLLIQRDRRLDGLGRVLTNSQLRAIERLLEQKQRELRAWQRLMTEIPDVNSHSGRLVAQHRS